MHVSHKKAHKNGAREYFRALKVAYFSKQDVQTFFKLPSRVSIIWVDTFLNKIMWKWELQFQILKVV